MKTLGDIFYEMLFSLRGHVGRTVPSSPAMRIQMVLIHTRLWTFAGRLRDLYARWKAGTLPRRRPSRAGRPRPAQPDAAQPDAARPEAARPDAPAPDPAHPNATAPDAAKPRVRLSRAWAWLSNEVGYTARGCRSVLEFQAATPEFAEFIAAVPQARRILRPLLHILGARPMPPLLAYAPRKPRPPRPRTPRPKREKPVDERIRGIKGGWAVRDRIVDTLGYPKRGPFPFGPPPIPEFRKKRGS